MLTVTRRMSRQERRVQRRTCLAISSVIMTIIAVFTLGSQNELRRRLFSPTAPMPAVPHVSVSAPDLSNADLATSVQVLLDGLSSRVNEGTWDTTVKLLFDPPTSSVGDKVDIDFVIPQDISEMSREWIEAYQNFLGHPARAEAERLEQLSELKRISSPVTDDGIRIHDASLSYNKTHYDLDWTEPATATEAIEAPTNFLRITVTHNGRSMDLSDALDLGIDLGDGVVTDMAVDDIITVRNDPESLLELEKTPETEVPEVPETGEADEAAEVPSEGETGHTLTTKDFVNFDSEGEEIVDQTPDEPAVVPKNEVQLTEGNEIVVPEVPETKATEAEAPKKEVAETEVPPAKVTEPVAETELAAGNDNITPDDLVQIDPDGGIIDPTGPVNAAADVDVELPCSDTLEQVVETELGTDVFTCDYTPNPEDVLETVTTNTNTPEVTGDGTIPPEWDSILDIVPVWIWAILIPVVGILCIWGIIKIKKKCCGGVGAAPKPTDSEEERLRIQGEIDSEERLLGKEKSCLMDLFPAGGFARRRMLTSKPRTIGKTFSQSTSSTTLTSQAILAFENHPVEISVASCAFQILWIAIGYFIYKRVFSKKPRPVISELSETVILK